MAREVTSPQRDKSLDLNEPLDWQPVPDKYDTYYTGHGGVEVSEIPIGAPNPILQFQDWEGKYWRKKSDLKDEYEEGFRKPNPLLKENQDVKFENRVIKFAEFSKNPN